MNIKIDVDPSELIARVATIVLNYTNIQLSKEQASELTKKILNDAEVQDLLKSLVTIK